MALSKIKTNSIADDAVTSAKVASGGIATLDMADGSITSLKIADGGIATVDIADSAITTVKLADANVTPAKLSTGGITWSSAGNVGLNTAASGLSWATGNNVLALGSSNAVAWSSNTYNTRLGNNLYHDGTNYKFVGSSWANYYSLNDAIGAHTWYASTVSGSANATVTLNSMMRLTKDAYLGVGVGVSPSYPLEVAYGTPTAGSQISDIAYFRPLSSQGGYGATGSRILLGAAINGPTIAPISAVSSYLQDGNSTGGGGLAIWTKTAGDASLIRRVNIDQGGQVGIGLEPGGNGLLEIGVPRNNTALAITQTPSASNSFGDELRMDFRMSNEINQYTGNPAARIASYLQRGSNGYGLKVYTRSGPSTMITSATFDGDGGTQFGGHITASNIRPHTYYSYSNSTGSSSYTITNVDSGVGRDQGLVFDIVMIYRAYQAASNWGIYNARYVCDFANQNGRTYTPIWHSGGNGNTGYGRTCTGSSMTKPDPYNSLMNITFTFDNTASIEMYMSIRPVSATSNAGLSMYF